MVFSKVIMYFSYNASLTGIQKSQNKLFAKSVLKHFQAYQSYDNGRVIMKGCVMEACLWLERIQPPVGFKPGP